MKSKQYYILIVISLFPSNSALMASYFLKEKLNLLGKVGCLLCLLGSTLIVVHAPISQDIQTMEELLNRILEPGMSKYFMLVSYTYHKSVSTLMMIPDLSLATVNYSCIFIGQCD